MHYAFMSRPKSRIIICSQFGFCPLAVGQTVRSEENSFHGTTLIIVLGYLLKTDFVIVSCVEIGAGLEI